jgi:hypothetical protein
MNRADHHHEADRLLSEARKEQDGLRRSQILAEAQVHATLALIAAPATIPSGPGQPEISLEELVPLELPPHITGHGEPAAPPPPRAATTAAGSRGPAGPLIVEVHVPYNPLEDQEKPSTAGNTTSDQVTLRRDPRKPASGGALALNMTADAG